MSEHYTISIELRPWHQTADTKQSAPLPSRSAVTVDAEKVKSSVSAVWYKEGHQAHKTLHQNPLLGKSRGQPANQPNQPTWKNGR